VDQVMAEVEVSQMSYLLLAIKPVRETLQAVEKLLKMLQVKAMKLVEVEQAVVAVP